MKGLAPKAPLREIVGVRLTPFIIEEVDIIATETKSRRSDVIRAMIRNGLQNSEIIRTMIGNRFQGSKV